MANSDAMFEMAQGMAKRILTEAPGDDSLAKRERAKLAFSLCYARAADDDEIEAVIAYQESQAAQFAEDPAAAKSVAHADFAENPVEPASWTAVARALMNTDEFITRE